MISAIVLWKAPLWDAVRCFHYDYCSQKIREILDLKCFCTIDALISEKAIENSVFSKLI